MKIIAADDERLSLKALVEVIKEAIPNAQVFSFQKTSELLAFAKENSCDIAFLDIQMRGMNGIELAKLLKDLQPRINIIFATGYSEYALEALRLHASGYLMKPISAEDVAKEVKNLRNPVLNLLGSNYDDNKLVIQCFGAFEAFYKNKPVEFTRSKSKEVLAYLVHRNGAIVSSPDIAGVIWEDGIFDLSRQKQLQTILSDLRKSLANIGQEDVIQKHKLGISIDRTKVECDLYKFIKGDIDAINSYNGEYMTNYYWAEFTTDYLDRVKIQGK